MVIVGVPARRGIAEFLRSGVVEIEVSFVAWVAAMYSASQEDREIVGCFFVDQLTRQPNI